MHNVPMVIATSLNDRIVPMNVSKSSTNLKRRYVKSVGTRKIATYIHLDSMPKKLGGKGLSNITYPRHMQPATNPMSDAQRMSLIGFRNSAIPVTIRRVCVTESQLCAAQTTNPVATKRTPMKKPRPDVIFTSQRNGFPKMGVRPTSFSSSQEVAAIPPTIRRNGVLFTNNSRHNLSLRN